MSLSGWPGPSVRRSGAGPQVSTPKQYGLHLSRAERHETREAVADLHLRIDAQRLQQAGGQILRRDGVVRGIRRETIRATDDSPAGHAAAGEHERITLRPMIAAGLVDAVAGELPEARRAAEFARADHERAVQQASLGQIFQER